MIGLKMDSSELDKLMKKLRTERGEQEFKQTLDRLTSETKIAVDIRTPVFSGETRGSIFDDIRGKSPELRGVVATSLRTGVMVERGTKPHMPPASSGLPYPARRAIAERGTRGRFMFRRGLAAMRIRIKEEGDKLAKTLLSKWGFK